jgi:hypothetical protein
VLRKGVRVRLAITKEEKNIHMDERFLFEIRNGGIENGRTIKRVKGGRGQDGNKATAHSAYAFALVHLGEFPGFVLLF